MALTRTITLDAVLKDTNLNPIPNQTVSLVQKVGSVQTPLPPIPLGADGTGSQLVAVPVPGTFEFDAAFAGAVVGGVTYSPSSAAVTVHVGTKTFSGKVTLQVGPGEAVTVTIIAPDGTVQMLTAFTQLDGTFTGEFDGTQLGKYQTSAKMLFDGKYAAVSATATFTI